MLTPRQIKPPIIDVGGFAFHEKKEVPGLKLIPIQLMIATHHWVKTRFISSLRMVYLSHSFFKLVSAILIKDGKPDN